MIQPVAVSIVDESDDTHVLASYNGYAVPALSDSIWLYPEPGQPSDRYVVTNRIWQISAQEENPQVHCLVEVRPEEF